MMTLARQVRDLWAGRHDAYGGDEGRAIWQPVTDELVQQHLDGTKGVGIYPIIHNGENTLWVKWGCCDIDTGDWDEAYSLAHTLNKLGCHAYVERSRSKGWHVWVFADQWVPARVMRRALKVAYKIIELPAKEANPKSEELGENQLGNYVRLPYKGVTRGLPERQVMMRGWGRSSDGEPWHITDFLGNVKYTSHQVLEYWAEKWYEPPKATIGVDRDIVLSDSEVAGLAARLPKPLYRLWSEGPQKADRSDTLVALAHQIAKLGVQPQECFLLVRAADMMWGKYSSRTNGEQYLLDIVERAYR